MDSGRSELPATPPARSRSWSRAASASARRRWSARSARSCRCTPRSADRRQRRHRRPVRRRGEAHHHGGDGLRPDQHQRRPGALPVRHARAGPVLVPLGRAGPRRARRGGAGRHPPAGRLLPVGRLLRAARHPVPGRGQLLRRRAAAHRRTRSGDALDLDPDVPVVLCDARDRESGKQVLRRAGRARHGARPAPAGQRTSWPDRPDRGTEPADQPGLAVDSGAAGVQDAHMGMDATATLAVAVLVVALAGTVYLVVGGRGRRGIATAAQRATYEVLHTAGLAAEPLRAGLTPAQRGEGRPPPADAWSARPGWPDRPRGAAGPRRARRAPPRPAARGGPAGGRRRPVRPCCASRDLPCDLVDCPVRGAVVAPLTGAGRAGWSGRWSRSPTASPAPGLVQATLETAHWVGAASSPWPSWTRPGPGWPGPRYGRCARRSARTSSTTR